jgi:hypothetical protein
VLLSRQPRLAQAADDLPEEVGRGGEIEEHVAAGAVLAGHLVEQRGEARVDGGVAELARLVVQRLAELGPELLLHRHRGELGDVLGLLLAELLVGHRSASDAHDGDLARQEPVRLEVVESRQELALGEVSRGAEDDDRAGSGGTELFGVEGRGFAHGRHPRLAARRQLDVEPSDVVSTV